MKSAAIFSGNKKVQLALCAGGIVFGMGQTMLFVILPPVARHMGLSEVEVGVIFSTSAVLFVLTSHFWGVKADMWGRNNVLSFGLMSLGLTTLFFSVALHFFPHSNMSTIEILCLLLLIRAMYGATTSGIQPASIATLADITTRANRTNGNAILGVAFGFGSVAGPLLTLLFSSDTPSYSLYLLSFFAIVAAIFVWLLRDTWPPTKSSEISSSKSIGISDLRIKNYVLCTFLLFIVLAILQQTTAFMAQDKLDLNYESSVQTAGIFFSELALSMLATQLLVIRQKLKNPRTLFRPGSCLLVLGFGLLLPHGGVLVMHIAFPVLGIGFGFLILALQSSVSLAVNESEQGAAAGVSGAATALGYIFGPLVGGYLYSLDMQYPVILCLVCMIGVLILGSISTSTIREEGSFSEGNGIDI